MIRLFTDPENISDGTIKLSACDTRKLREEGLGQNETFIVCDGNRTDYICRITETQEGTAAQEGQPPAEGDRMLVQILSKQKSRSEPSIECTVYIAYAETKRLEYAVQKSVELGAYKIVLYGCARCTAKPRNVQKKVEQLQTVALKAAKESGRGIIPKVSAIDEFNHVVDIASDNYDLVMLCYEEEENLSIMTVLSHFFPLYKHNHINKALIEIRSIAIITGPVGGFDPAEVKLAQSEGISIVSLGARLLRSETAPVVALSAIMYHTRNL